MKKYKLNIHLKLDTFSKNKSIELCKKIKNNNIALGKKHQPHISLMLGIFNGSSLKDIKTKIIQRISKIVNDNNLNIELNSGDLVQKGNYFFWNVKSNKKLSAICSKYKWQ